MYHYLTITWYCMNIKPNQGLPHDVEKVVAPFKCTESSESMYQQVIIRRNDATFDIIMNHASLS